MQYIESFFKNELNASERELFEQKCQTDQDFANEVALYAKAKYGFTKQQNSEKKQRFDDLYRKTATTKALNPKVWWIAASIFLFAIVGRWYFVEPNYTDLADNYIKENLTILSSSMGTESDSLQMGINYYNKGEFQNAKNIFENINPNNPEALKNAGITNLKLANYDKAIFYFEKLEKMDLKVNEGSFLKGVTLVKAGEVELGGSLMKKNK